MCVCVCVCVHIFSTPQHKKDTTQGQFLNKLQSFLFPRLILISRLTNPVCPIIYPLLEGEYFDSYLIQVYLRFLKYKQRSGFNSGHCVHFITIIIINIMSRCQYRSPWPSFSTRLYRHHGYILYQQRASIYMF